MATVERPRPELSEVKRALLDKRVAAAAGRTAERIPRRASAGPAPLSFAQERLWFLHQLEPESPAYNMPSALRLTGGLDAAVLERTLSEIVRRHESLRTTFTAGLGEPREVIHPAAAMPVLLPVVDLAALPGALRERASRRLADEEARRPFHLAEGPLLRAALLRLGAGEHVLLLTLHHVVSDGWSLGLLIREVSVLYPAFLEGRPPGLPELPVQYADFAVWQREWLQGEVLQRQLDWWKAHLGGAPAVLELPLDRPRPAVRSSRGGHVPVSLEPELARELAALSRREGATLFMTYLAAFEMLLARLSGRTDLVVGTPIAGRVRTELEDLIGLFVNTLALRGELSGDPELSELLARVRRAALGAYAHQELPFERLVEELAPERNLTHTPLIQVLFVFQNAPMDVLDLPGLRWRRLEVDAGTAKFDLTLTLSEEEDGVAGELGFNRDLFDETTVRRWAGHLEALLAGIVREPQARLSERELLAPSERHQILLGWNDTARGPVTRTVHGLFAEQARSTPEAVALRFEGEELSFGELDRRANRLARFLQGCGVGPDVLVGLCLERSLEMVVGVLGILKAGGGFVPLDPGYPPERLAYMLEDAEAPVLLSHSSLLGHLPASAAERILLDTDWERVAGQSAEDPGAPVEPDHLACVLYTSGSTGRPKGVMDPHRSVVNQILWLQSTYRLDGTDRVLQKTPISWDVSLWELFWPLTSGATMVLARPGGHQDPDYMAATLEREGITTVHFVPSMLRIFLDMVDARDFPELRRVVSSGEALTLDLEEKFFSAFRVDLNNMYGPGESARASLWRCERGNDRAVAPIGRPTHEVQLYVLDRRLEPVPIGVAGELYVGGQSLARGYHRRPDLTAEKFLPEPFGRSGREPGSRLYRTGDLARTMADGKLEFLGRIDHQVKIRGVRIELGEIESVLGQCPGVADAVVVARPDATGELRLAAYVVPDGDGVGAEDLQGHLRSKLPDYMVPESWVFLAALPLAPNGKADRERLPEPQWVVSRGDYVAPRKPVEELLAAVWAEVLKVDRVGVQDAFFDLGGNSLLATQVASRIRAVFGVEMPLRAVFERPTLASLAGAVSELLREESGSVAPPVVPVPRNGPLPLSFAQLRLWFLARFHPQSPAYNVPVVLRLAGPLAVFALERALADLERRHESLRTTFTEAEGEPLQRIGPPVFAALPCVDLAGLAQREPVARSLVSEASRQPFDLARDRPMRALLVRLSAGEHVLLINLHHIVSDAWSRNVLIEELARLYEAHLTGGPAGLPELPIQYADYASWQRQWYGGDTLAPELAYWKTRLAGAAVLELPMDRPRPAIQSFRGGGRWLDLEPELAAKLRALARRQSATLFMTLLAAFKALLVRYTGQVDVSVGTPVSGRNRLELEGLIGCFVNTLVQRTDLAGDPAFPDLLRRVRETVLEAHAHQDLPFERLVKELQPERSLARTPLFQVMLILQDVPQRCDLFDLGVELLEPETGTAKFDLTLALVDREPDLIAWVEYSSDLFEAGTAVRFLGHFVTLLTGLVEDPGRRISELPLLTGEEIRQLAQWNATAAPVREGALPELFAAQAQATPEAVAVVLTGESLTYAELDRRADELAGYLCYLGVEPEVRVALHLERSLDMLVAILGVLKAGGAYVPLDPVYPSERLAFILADAGAPVLLTQESLAGTVPAQGAHVVRLDADRERIARHGQRSRPIPADPGNTAYVIYTSGSTGRPKGVAVTHANVLRLFAATEPWFHFDERDVWTMFHSYAFDFSVWEIWGALLYGGRLVIVPYLLSRSPEAFYELLCDERVTVLNQTPSAFSALIRAESLAAREEDLALRYVIFGGEALELQSLRPWFELHGDEQPRLINMYGITETTVHVTYRPIRLADLDRGAGSVVGVPIPDLQVLLLDRSGSLVPIGVPGELHVSGAGLSRGYVGRPALTAERFVPAPFSSQPGERLYRSGDLARWLANGDLEYLGRIDHQVKLRGFRIELGEIEAVLAQHPAVRESAVLVRRDAAGQPRLVAYVVAAGGAPLDVAGLRELLARKLPEYMVPAAFVPLAALPLTPNGKLDRAALPEPSSERPELGREFVAPNGPVEELTAGIWADLLGVERVGAQDNFFELGGHSLLATQVASRMREALRVDFPLRDLFDHPTVAGLSRRLAASVRRSSGIPPLVRMPRDGALPLSFAQQRMWLLDQYAPGNPAYNVLCTLRLRGHLAPEVLARSLGEIVRRHEILRTTFPLAGGRPVQVIQPFTPLRLWSVDLERLAPDRAEAELRRLALEQAQLPFALDHGPLMRVGLVRAGRDEHVLLATLHHIVSDAWSFAVLTREIAVVYDALLDGREPALPELPFQYVDFADWQRQWMRGDVLADEVDHWRRALGGGAAALRLPTDRPWPAALSWHGETRTFTVGRELTAAVRALGRERRATLFMTLLAVFQSLLHRYAQQEDVRVGVPIAGRNHLETESLIGFFVNSLVLRTDFSGLPTLLDLLDQVRETTLEAYVHQDLPFEKLVEELQPARGVAAEGAMFQAAFVLHPPTPAMKLRDLDIEWMEVDRRTAKFAMTLFVREDEESLHCSWEHSTDLFDSTTIDRMIGHFENLLHELVHAPGRRISEALFLTPGESHQLLLELNDSARSYPSARGLHRLFEEQAERHPELAAVSFEDDHLSFAELNRRCNRLARFLRQLGVGADSVVGVCAERGFEMVVGVMGILKAGGAYLPLDPSYPQERLTYMMEDARVEVLLTQEHLLGLLPGTSARILCLDRDGTTLAQESSGNLDVEVSPLNLAYVIYTSGSTGNPKGVMVPHLGVCNLVFDRIALLGIQPGDRSLQFSAFSFDVAALEIFESLLSGSTLHLERRDVLMPGEGLNRLMRERAIHRAALLPSVLAATPPEGLPGLHTLTTGAETCPIEVLQSWSGGREFFNAYGPTETSIMSSLAHCTDTGRRPTIGRPFADTQIYIVDAWINPMPLGTPGELLIGGIGVSRGYLRQPALTAERFIPDPFSPQPGARLYRTGDLAHFVQDGEIEFLGRVDSQVKVRGFRIELGEVELALVQHEAVQEAAVVDRADRSGNKRLVAYVVPEPGPAPAVSVLREFLLGKMPEHMVPSLFVLLEALPLKPNGKVDRQALPAPQELETGPGDAFVPPRDLFELRLARIWEDLLEVRPVGVTANFFELGGHSLLGVRLLARIKEDFGRELPLATLLQAGTIQDLATLLRAGQAGAALPVSRLVVLRSGGTKLPFFCVHASGGSVLAYDPLARHLDGDRPFFAFQAAGLEDGEEPRTSIEEMAADYVEEMREVQPQGPYLLGGWSAGGVVAYEMAQQLLRQGEDVALLALLDSGLPREEERLAGYDELAALASLQQELGFEPPGSLAEWTEMLRRRAPEDRIRTVLAQLRDAEVLPREIGLEQLHRLVKVNLTNIENVYRYQPRRYPKRILHLKASEAVRGIDLSSNGTWEALTEGGVEVVEVPGTHYTMVTEPFVRRLAELLRVHLDMADRVLALGERHRLRSA